MTSRINIRIEADSAAEARQQMIGLLGDSYKVDTGWRDSYASTVLSGEQPMSPDAEVLPDEGPNFAAMKAAHDATQAEAPKRERGKPAPGRARRTKEEIAEDEAADKADASAPTTEATPLISTGEERIDPTAAEDAAQDAADEAAEVEATKAPELTHDDVRAALQKYLTAYGTPAAMEDGPKVLTMLFGAEVTKVSAVPADQASLAKAVAGIEEMLVKNPFKRSADL
jgi:hypothetical protein